MGDIYNASGVKSLVLALTAALAAVAPPPGQQTGASRVALAAVTDPRNKPLVDVSADDFVIQEAGTPREILSVRPADYPIFVLLDTGGDARLDFPLMQKAATHFIDRVGQRPIAIGTFGGEPKLVASFEDERPAVLTKLAALTADPAAPSLLLQGAGLGGRTIKATGTLFFKFGDLDATKPAGSIKIRVETIVHYLSRHSPEIIARKLAVLSPSSPLSARPAEAAAALS